MIKLTSEQKEHILNNRVGSNIYEKAKQRFLMLPAGLVYGSLYKTLSADAKFAWTILNDRSKLSAKNGWYDENGDIYFVFSIDTLKEILQVSKPTVIKIKKELEEYGLLEQRRMGLTRANRLYIFEPVLLEEDYRLIQKNESYSNPIENTSENVDFTLKSKFFTSRSKNSLPHEVKEIYSNNTNINNTNINNKNESAKAESQIDFFKKNKKVIDYSFAGIPETLTDELFRATGDTRKVDFICSVIFQAKRYVVNQSNCLILFENMTEDDFNSLAKCILRALKNDLTKGTIENFDKYLFATVKNFFENYINENQLMG